MGLNQSVAQNVQGADLVSDIININSQFQAQSISTTAVQLLGGGTILANRKAIFATPTNGTIYVGTSSAVTSANGTPVLSGNTITFSFSSNVQLWAIGLATTDVRVLEVS